MGEASGATGGGTARAELARRIGEAWTRSGCLAQERIEARLKSRFAGRGMRGLSDSSFNRYKDPEATALPDAEVLAALAELFGVGDEEGERWARLLEEARTEARRRRAAVRGTKASPEPSGGVGDASPAAPTEPPGGRPGPGRVVGPAPPGVREADRSEGRQEDQLPDRQEGHHARDRREAQTPGRQEVHTPDRQEGHAPDRCDGRHEDRAPARREDRAPALHEGRDAARAEGPGVGRRRAGRRVVVGVVALGAVVAAWAVFHLPSPPVGDPPTRPSAGRAAPPGGDAAEDGADALGGPVGPSAVTGTAAPGPMTGDYRCGKVRPVEHAAWSACSQVLDGGDTLRFAVRIDNPGSRAVTVRARLSWVRSRVVTPCPAPWGTGVRLTVPAGRSAVTPLDACPRKSSRPSAYQAMAWVIGESDMGWGERETSMTVHVQPDRYRWNDQLP
ncbi:hypothetical protein ACH4ZU_13050 [Streptomyces sp. NPDC020472]|uniref:hypothetical protein n=1 Tax=Streptomyces sp. NPDC020472 TaxID=3365075 RepID=UPI0037A63CAD